MVMLMLTVYMEEEAIVLECQKFPFLIPLLMSSISSSSKRYSGGLE